MKEPKTIITSNMDKLKRAAFEVLRDNEGCECQDWMDALIGEYGEIGCYWRRPLRCK